MPDINYPSLGLGVSSSTSNPILTTVTNTLLILFNLWKKLLQRNDAQNSALVEVIHVCSFTL
jgi:hypothetical protein